MADPSPKPSPLRKRIWALVMLGLVVGTAWVLWQAYRAKQAAVLAKETPKPQTPSVPKAQEATPPEEFVARVTPVVDFPPLPSLSESDDWLRQELPELDQNPFLIRWVQETPDLLRKFVALADEIAQGKVPRKLFDSWAPKESLQVIESESGEYRLDPASYHRYDALAAAVEAVDVDLAWRLYRHLKPRIEEAYAEIGRPGVDFDQVLLNAIEHLLSTPQPPAEIRLIKKAVGYRYADPQLEALSAAQKQLLRMGPVNAAIVKHKLGLLRGLLLGQEAVKPPESGRAG
ncbi:DUF3014 domain-containing protein [Methylothermus subterraneus]